MKRVLMMFAAVLALAACSDSSPTEVDLDLAPPALNPQFAVTAEHYTYNSTSDDDGTLRLIQPLDVAPGDLLLVQFDAILDFLVDVLCAPAGWERLSFDQEPGSFTGQRVYTHAVYYRLADGTEPSISNFRISSTNCVGTKYQPATGAMMSFRGVNQNTPIRGFASAGPGTNAPSVADVRQHDEVVMLFGTQFYKDSGTVIATSDVQATPTVLLIGARGNEGPSIMAAHAPQISIYATQAWTAGGWLPNFGQTIVLAHPVFPTSVIDVGVANVYPGVIEKRSYPSRAGETVTLYAELVSHPSGVADANDPSPSFVRFGFVLFYEGGTCDAPGAFLGEAEVDVHFDAQQHGRSYALFTTSDLSVGEHHIVACYLGLSETFLKSGGAVPATFEVVAPDYEFATVATITANPVGSAQFGSSVTFTAHITSEVPLSAFLAVVKFYRNGTCASPGQLLGEDLTLLGHFDAEVTVNSLPSGLQRIIACFEGVPAHYAPSEGVLDFLVTITNSFTALTVTPSTAVTTETPVTLSAHVTYQAGNAPMGTVDFYRGGTSCSNRGTQIGSAQISDGFASITVSQLSAGFASMVACYGGLGGTLTQSGDSVPSFRVTLTTTVNNPPEVTSHGGPYSGSVNQPVSFHATATDQDGDQVTYAWNFGDGATATGAAATHAYAAAGDYSVRLTVTDEWGDRGFAATTASISAGHVNTAPVINNLDAPAGDEGSPVSFSASASDADGDALSFSWNFGDGGTGAGASPTHTYADNGTYTVTLTVSDGHGGTTTASALAVISNVAPTATLSAPESVMSSAYILLAMGNPQDVAADLGSLEFAFSCDGTNWGAFGISRKTTCPALGHGGTLTVGGRVRDKDGGVTTYNTDINVIQENRAPVIGSMSVPATSTEGTSIDVTSSASDADNDPLTYSWDFGDGSSANTQNATHVFADNGSYTVTLTVADGQGGVDTQNQTVVVSNVAPTATFNAPSSVVEAQPIQLSLTNTHDVAADAGSLEFAFSCDGVSWSVFGSSDSASCPTNRFGTRNVGGRVMDKDGGVSTYSTQVTIQNVAPVVASFAGAEIMGGETYHGATSFTDVGQDDPWTATVNYGDGSGTQALALAGWSMTLAHTYANPGVYTVRVTVTDAGGASSQSAAVVTVLSATQSIDRLGSSLNALVAAGKLRSSDIRPLNALLSAAQQQLDRGNRTPAFNQLGAFIHRVEAMMKSGRLSAADGNALNDYAKRIQVSISH
ncbi:MAG TPA: PKD domain-containing protein [Longimicrobiales bacterium]|nr:PKD domain-containing protein [Longimicrobiales bacterium]